MHHRALKPPVNSSIPIFILFFFSDQRRGFLIFTLFFFFFSGELELEPLSLTPNLGSCPFLARRHLQAAPPSSAALFFCLVNLPLCFFLKKNGFPSGAACSLRPVFLPFPLIHASIVRFHAVPGSEPAFVPPLTSQLVAKPLFSGFLSPKSPAGASSLLLFIRRC